MYFFFHVLTGAVIGLLIGDILHDRRWVLLCMFGAVLPDLVDKPLGLLVFNDSIGYGRVFGHALLTALVLLILGLITWKWLKSPVVTGIAAGILSHQVLDAMWRIPKVWMYPVYGPFQGNASESVFFTLALSELKNPAEILLALLLLAGVLLVVYKDNILKIIFRYPGVWRWLMTATALFFGVFSVLCGYAGVLLWGSQKKQVLNWMKETGITAWTGWTLPEYWIIGGVVFLLAMYLVWRWRRLEPEKGSDFRC